ncbi:type 1 fimbrial protein [Serratia bockelmannii]|uniref:fimbrial protein n=1 Tax=Serratia bockelmannii TaxID=2703793 RepID=UPI002240255B|nr:fimbrial protein [Serratia bockelmannii]MCW7649164.1 type 1 fimbrial protein [Serratia bockelmannii]MCW7659201.1 type 1 fimbrial protein [Serratia bockelmannii]MCW7678985.1 type 1 fimbrial protein [Serratia bockelmannii]MCW7683762.1 type 1 fimbrial protein [Serratia bockelmannii]MCW7688539.1 type 1 fimbrial protein [Serratia bockelmannii]
MLFVGFRSLPPYWRSAQLICPLILLTGLSTLSLPSWADLGVVNLYMRANLVSSACSVSADSINKTVNLGVWATRQFVETPTPVPLVRFTINLEDCGPAASGVKLSWNGTAHVSNNELFALTSGSSATNVGVELLDWNRKRIAPGYTTPAYGLTANASNVSIPFYARYVRAGGVVTAGTANSMATFTLEYL